MKWGSVFIFWGEAGEEERRWKVEGTLTGDLVPLQGERLAAVLKEAEGYQLNIWTRSGESLFSLPLEQWWTTPNSMSLLAEACGWGIAYFSKGSIHVQFPPRYAIELLARDLPVHGIARLEDGGFVVAAADKIRIWRGQGARQYVARPEGKQYQAP